MFFQILFITFAFCLFFKSTSVDLHTGEFFTQKGEKSALSSLLSPPPLNQSINQSINNFQEGVPSTHQTASLTY